MAFFRPVHGLIFLFKYVQDDEPAGSVVRDSRLEKIFFAKQVCFGFIFMACFFERTKGQNTSFVSSTLPLGMSIFCNK